MSRYIEKEAFIALLNKRIYCLCGGETVKETRNIRDMLEVFPPADVKPVVRGEWVDKFNKGKAYMQSFCSACGKHSGIGGIKSNRHKPYCPNCGAEMREEANDER